MDRDGLLFSLVVREFRNSVPVQLLYEGTLVKTIGIVGSRRRKEVKDYIKLRRKFVEIFEKGDRIVSGGCPEGGDRFAEQLARNFGCTITIHHADWTEHGDAAGPIRNTSIAQDCTLLRALVAADRTGGAEDTVRKVERLKKEVILL